MAQSTRMVWVDGLRTVMILLVISMHACVTYSHVGSWYFMVTPEPTIMVKLPFVLWQGHLQAFFMGLLFFVSGYLADRSLPRKTTSQFLAERFRRLGVPTLIYMLVIHPFIVYGMLVPPSERPSVGWYFTDYIGKGKFIGNSGPMWFAFALLLFCIPFAFWGRIRQASTESKPFQLSGWTVLGLGIGLGLVSFVVRLWQPVGTSILNFQLCYFPQYLLAFPLGVYVSRRDALELIAKSNVARWAGWLAVILGPIAVLSLFVAAAPDLGKNPPPINGGMNWEAMAVALWEQCSGVGLALGVIALCYRKLNVDRPIMSWLSERSFGMYLLHAPILVAIALWFQKLGGNVFVMTILLTMLGWLFSSILTEFIRRVQVLRAFI